jgi:hypothetical protein
VPFEGRSVTGFSARVQEESFWCAVQQLMVNVFCKFGVPSDIAFHRDTRFTSNLYRASVFYKEFNCLCGKSDGRAYYSVSCYPHATHWSELFYMAFAINEFPLKSMCGVHMWCANAVYKIRCALCGVQMCRDASDYASANDSHNLP